MSNHGHKPMSTAKMKSGHEFPSDFGFCGGGKVRVRAHFREGGRVNGAATSKMLDTVENVELGSAGKQLRSGFAKGGKVHSDAAMDRAMIKKSVHKHEKHLHPGAPLTKLAKGGVPAHGRKPMIRGC